MHYAQTLFHWKVLTLQGIVIFNNFTFFSAKITEIQFPVFLTPSAASEHDTMDEFTGSPVHRNNKECII